MAKQELAKKETQALSTRESFIPEGDRTGAEGITKDDLRLPRLGFAQGLSPQIIEGDSKYIPDLKVFDMFNDLSGEIYGKGPIQFIPVRRDVRRIEFIPRSEGGGVKDLNVPARDPRMEWETGPGGERIPPKATKFVEFVILLLHGEDRAPEPIVMSIKDTNKWNRAAAERLSGFIALGTPPKPIYGRIFSVASKPEKNDKGTFAVPVINPVMALDDPKVDDATWERNKLLYEFAKSHYEQFKDKTIHVEREEAAPNEYETTQAPVGGKDRPEM